MSTIFCLVSFSLRSSLRSRAALHAEILALRHQLLVLQRSTHGRRLCSRTADRIFWVWLSRLWQGWRLSLRIFKPETVIAWKSERIPLVLDMEEPSTQWSAVRTFREIQELIRRMSMANPRWGAPHINGELQKLGIQVSESTVDKYMVRPRRPSSQPGELF
jgi:putative transposase